MKKTLHTEINQILSLYISVKSLNSHSEALESHTGFYTFTIQYNFTHLSAPRNGKPMTELQLERQPPLHLLS